MSRQLHQRSHGKEGNPRFANEGHFAFCLRAVGFYCGRHSRPQRPRSFWSAPRIGTSGLVQRHSVFEWLCKYNRLRPEPIHSRSQRPRSFWSAPRIATSGPVQRHSVFEWLCKHNRLRSQPIRFVRLDSERAQSDGKSVNRGLPVLDMARGRDSWC